MKLFDVGPCVHTYVIDYTLTLVEETTRFVKDSEPSSHEVQLDVTSILSSLFYTDRVTAVNFGGRRLIEVQSYHSTGI